ncbi:hypothetical protein [Kurthia senegalensis]|uniref:hypothetical protein n=1 Tax=Kurthia senegalensis TaxID=1033740 RepID=UPI0002895DAC|nr:hypothetical protein [Kurthia senegalensis]
MNERQRVAEQEETQNQVKVDFDTECPMCSASIQFDPSSGKLICPYCGYETEIAEPDVEDQRTAQEMDFSAAEKRESYNWGVDKKTVICEECGAELIYDALQVADTCPYCGSNQVMEAATVDTLAPNGVCTFQITEKQAGENFQRWIKGKLFTPSAAKKSAKPESFQGVYIPYWTFDSHTVSHYQAMYGIDRVVKDREGNTRVETNWFPTSGIFQRFVDDELVLASTRYDRSLLQKVEPFQTTDNKAYKPDYLSGFLAERYSIGLDEGWTIAQNQIHQMLSSEISSQIRRRHGATHVMNLHFSTTHDQITYKYLMLPMWLSSFRYKDNVFQFMVNGQTGKVGGKAPISPLRVTIAVILATIVFILLYMYTQNS